MKKSKLIKTIVALAVSLVAAIGCISLVACGGGDPEVNSVSLNKPTLTLQVGGSETLVATTDPAGATVTWETADASKVTVNNGVVTAVAATTTPVVITAKAGAKSATCNVTVQEAGPTYPLTNTFSYTALTDYAGKVLADDNKALVQADLGGVNSFITLSGTANWRDTSKANGGAIEIKTDALQVTFAGAGTLTIGFGSTNSSNVSGLAVKDSSGAMLVAATVPTGVSRVETAEVVDGNADYTNEVGFYYCTGGQKLAECKTITFNIPAAGTYTISGRWCYHDDAKNQTSSRATRIFTLQTVDNGPQA